MGKRLLDYHRSLPTFSRRVSSLLGFYLDAEERAEQRGDHAEATAHRQVRAGLERVAFDDRTEREPQREAAA